MPSSAPVTRATQRLLSAAKAAPKLSVSVKTFYRYHKQGLVPIPVKLAGRWKWNEDELDRWISAGCPPRHEWEKMK